MRCFQSFSLSPRILKLNLLFVVDLRANACVIGVKKAKLFPGVPIYGGSHRSPALTQLVKGDDQFTIGNAINVKYALLTIYLHFLTPAILAGSTGVSQRPATHETRSATT